MPESSNPGGRKPRVTDTDLLDVFRATSDPVLSTAEVAEQVPIKRRGVLNRLRQLEDRDALASKQIGGRNTVWWLTEKDIAEHDSSATAKDERDRAAGAPTDPADAPGADTTTTDPLADVDFPSGRDRDDCLAAVYAARDYLREHGPASMREIVTDVMPEYPLGYEVPDLAPGDRYRGAWWRNVVKPGLNALDDVDAPAGGGNWRAED